MRSALRRCSSTLPQLLTRTSSTSRIAPGLSHIVTPQLARPSTFVRCLSQSTLRQQQSAAAVAEPPQTPVRFTRFQELADSNVIHPAIVKTLTQRMGMDTMTEVQSRTISTTVDGTDCIAQARTGTGKTIAFLLPILQNIISVDPNLARPNYSRRGARTTADDIRAIIISPTRELAEQIAMEAKRLVEGTSIVVQAAVGGTQKSAGLRAIQREGCHILVATPGRLNDILSDSYSRVEAPDLSALVFDEADRLMEAGFWREIESIVKYLPDPKVVPRQTLMFSATVPKEVVEMVRTVMRPGFAFEQCVRDDEEPTHERVPQYISATHGLENQIPAVVELITREVEKARQPGARPFKAIVYFSATAEVALAQEVINRLELPSNDSAEASSMFRGRNHPWPQTRVYEIHSRLSQAARTRAADSFRTSKSGVLLSSDVTARGLDFPDVTHVIQIGVPSNTEQYVHRIGRTARAGKEGEGWLFVDENLQLPTARRLLGRLPIKRDNTLEIAKLDLTQQLKVSENAGSILAMVQKAMAGVDVDIKEQTFKSLIGAYRGGASSDRDLVRSLNNLAKFGWGLSQPPAISPMVAQKLGMGRIADLRIGHSSASRNDSYGGGSRSERSGGFGRPGNDRFGGDRSGGDRFGGDRSRGGDRFGGDRPRGGDRFGGRSGGRRDSYGGSSGGYSRDAPSSSF